MKRYYHPLKECTKHKRSKLFFKFLNIFLKPATGKAEVEWRTQEPLDPAVFVANHTHTYAPLSMLFNFPLECRPWVNAYTLTYKNGIKLVYNKIAYDLKPRFIAKLGAIILMPLINLYFRSLDPVPVYHDIRIRSAFHKSTETLSEGINLVIYPEKNIKSPQKYINDLEPGFVHLAPHYYEKTGKKIKFYPVYCCKDLKKIIVGEPIEYDPDKNIKEQRNEITDYLVKAVVEIGDSLPEHTIYYNKEYPSEINKFNF